MGQQYFAQRALLPQGWADDVLLEVDHVGIISSVTANAAASVSGIERLQGPLIPGMANCHSHAFQRAMAGLAERQSGADASFWGWRDTMYRFVATLSPEQVTAIATQLYMEMLLAGYTGVAEFHYLHHGPGGQHYDDPAEMSHAIASASTLAGIDLTLLPVLYQFSDFGAVPAHAEQARFVHSNDAFQQLLQLLATRYTDSSSVTLGLALHSLRAVDQGAIEQALEAINALAPRAPIHIHIAEQQREVDACLAHFGQRPVAWLLDHFGVDERWCLVHATHLADTECSRLAASGAVAGLCPSTEANLGDGVFPALEYCRQGGQFAIGSDSHVSVDPVAELRLLEYGQRLLAQRRTVLTSQEYPSTGAYLYHKALLGGARTLGVNTGAIAPGARANLLVLDANSPILYGKHGDTLLDAWLLASQRPAISDVMVGGQWQVRAGRHRLQDQIESSYRCTLNAVMAQL